MRPPYETAKADIAPLQRLVPSSKAARDVLAERARRIEAEGWTAEHDAMHDNGELSAAAVAYIIHGQSWETQVTGGVPLPTRWPWHLRFWKPTNRRRDLVKAGALILAEIERLDRLAARGT